MKMEVLSVQNQFQGQQFGVIGSNKVKNWTSPLTPPPSSHSNNSDEVDHNHHRQNDNNLRINNIVSSVSATSQSQSNNDTDLNNDEQNNIEQQQQQQIRSPAVNLLSSLLQNELRQAKSRHLACTEVLLPADLLHRVAVEILKVSEKEPCGIRGCTVYIEFEDEPSNTRRIASLKTDPNTVSTFELYLTLKHDRSGWTSILPQFLKNLTRSSTIMISPEFILTKNKLYHSFSE